MQSECESFLFTIRRPRYSIGSEPIGIPRILARVCFFVFVVPEKKTSHFARFGVRPDWLAKVFKVSFMVLMVSSSAFDRMNRSSAKASEMIFKFSHVGWNLKGWRWDCVLRSWVNPSIVRMKRAVDKGSSCLRPLVDLKFPVREPLNLWRKRPWTYRGISNA